MDIHFCDCGGALTPSGRGKLKCRSCGKEIQKKSDSKMTTQNKKNDVIVIENNKPDRLPLTDKKCPKCDNKRAYWWIIQTRSSDEPPTRFFRCEKCKHTWREYS